MKRARSSKALKVIIMVSAILCTAILIGICIIMFKKQEVKEITTTYLQEQATKKINEYEYSKLVLDSEYTGTQDVAPVCEYVLTSSKTGSYRTYTYRDDEQDLYQCWESNKEKYDLYIYDKTVEKWVFSNIEYEPVSSDTWKVVLDLSQYKILEEPGNWGSDECWILQMMSHNDEWEVIYEELYIRKSDFMPMGVVSYANSKKDKDRISEIKPGEYEFGTITEGTEKVADYEELVSVYSLEFSNEALDLFDKPEEFITSEEYNKLIDSKESDKDVKSNN